MNAGDASFPAGWVDYKCVATYDRRDHFRIPTTTYDADTGVLTIRVTPSRDSLYLMYWAPYSCERHNDFIADVSGSPLVRHEVIGTTLDGRDVDLLNISSDHEHQRLDDGGGGEENAGGPTAKLALWLTGRQHPGESMASFYMEGFIRRLLSADDAASRALLRIANIFVIPNMNPDGTYRGNLRTNACGCNLNREWATPSLERSPEVWHCMRRMAETGVDFYMDVHGDEALPFNFISGINGIPKWGQRLETLQNNFVSLYSNAAPDFQSEHGYSTDQPGSANLKIASKAVGELYDCCSMTLEQPFKDTIADPCPRQGWSPARSRLFGSAVVEPLLRIAPQLR
jgi:murein tripeptide amidase MpaA